ncbi:hypothetical protein OG195_12570 [Streptomyces sp. NBC_01362]|uniref:hypothetical protein n=1 Tax=Streptomyces sp. NBC_01362 TaxID=2903839 RepID=UPI002E36CE13|nr:hypothetical protein [Streptomyces sp. NBC_01362]
MSTESTARVSSRTEKSLREAMERLLAGTPARTDGKLTKNNLWREAGVSRATMNRATNILTEWDSRIGTSPANQHAQRQAEELTQLRRKAKAQQRDHKKLQDQVDAAATVIAVLLSENTALRNQLAQRSSVVVPFPRATATQE